MAEQNEERLDDLTDIRAATMERIYSELANTLADAEESDVRDLQTAIIDYEEQYPESWRSIQRQKIARELFNTILCATGR